MEFNFGGKKIVFADSMVRILVRYRTSKSAIGICTDNQDLLNIWCRPTSVGLFVNLFPCAKNLGLVFERVAVNACQDLATLANASDVGEGGR